jgi:hypothetical protein
MTEYRNDLFLRLIEEISFLSARMAGLQAMGLSDEILKEVDRLDQAAGKLEPEQATLVRERLRSLQAP